MPAPWFSAPPRDPFLRLVASLCIALMGLTPASGCRRETAGPPRERETTRRPVPSAAASASPSASLEAPVASALVEIRERLSLAAPGPRLRRIAFGKGFLVQLTAEAAVVRNTFDGKQLVRAPLSGPRALLGLPGGSVLISTSSASYRLDPGQRFLHPRTRLSLLPGSLLEPSRESSEFVWVVEPSRKTAVRYALAPDAGLGLMGERELPRFDERAFTTLRDGSFLYTAGPELAHAQPFGKPMFLRTPPELGSLWRLSAADRVDRAWAVTTKGAVLLLELGTRARGVRTLTTGRLPIDFAATPTRLALLSVVEAPKAAREFVLSVYTSDGVELFSRPVGTGQPSAGSEWTASVLRDQELTLGTEPPQVAIGGPGALRVFALDSGVEQILRDQ